MKYDIEYYEKMLRQNAIHSWSISKKRWDWIVEIGPNTVLDYGSGCGFFRAYRPEGIVVYSYDIGPYPQTGIELTSYDVVCFWDVLEHIADFSIIEPVIALAKHIALSLPIKPDNVLWDNWKHFKPNEHLHYWTGETVQAFFNQYGFKLMKSGYPECPPREDIKSFLFKRKERK